MLGLITGSGLYDIPGLEKSRTEEVPTPYGSVHLTLGIWNGCPVAFIPRHGVSHRIPPHRIN